MSDLYPLLMSPMFDPRPWGALDLSPIYPNHKFAERIGESWLTGDECQVAAGPLKGLTLAELSRRYGRTLVGEAASDANRFPLLVKFLFPQDKLSVQVHPDDAAALRVGQPWGKTECWYVAHAQPGAQIALGLKTGVTRAELEQGIRQQRVEQLLNWINVYAGELIYVAGGTVHTLGPGVVMVETQQQSDATYRLYDYGRPRELHLHDGLDAVKETVCSGKVIRPAPRTLGKKDVFSRLVSAPYFVVEKYELTQPIELSTADETKSSVQILVALEGCGVVECGGTEPVTLAKGDAVVVPASMGTFSMRPQWKVELLRARVPGEVLSEPATRM